MSLQYQTRCSLFLDGQEIQDFKTVTEHKVGWNKQVPLMNQTGSALLMPRYGVTLDYVVPVQNRIDWSTVTNATLIIVDEQSGETRTYTGVCTADEGEAKRDPENEVVQAIELIAEDRMVS